jgi:transposase
MGYILPADLRITLLARHRKERDGRVKDRIKAVLLRDDGLTYEEIASVLYLSDEGVRQQVEDYLKREKLMPENGGSAPKLDKEQTAKLIAHLEDHTYLWAKEIVAYVEKTFGITYTVSGMTVWLKAHGFSYHQPAVVPAKADAAKQKEWVKQYEALKTGLGANEQIVFMDAVHPTHEVRVVRGWIRKGIHKEIRTNGSGRRLNIVGALNLETMTLAVQEYDTIDAKAIKAFFDHLQASMPTAAAINVVLDQARYHTCPEVKAYLTENPKIRLHHLPTYSPNLNAIERAWKIMHEHTTYSRYYATFKEFTEAIRTFFAITFPAKAKKWTDRLTDNFRLMGTPLLANS